MNDHAPNSLTIDDGFDPARARALQATLGDVPSIRTGDILPPFFHQIYFWDAQPPESLGSDGHPARGGFIPDAGLPNRMWAAGKLVFHHPLIAGTRSQRTSRVESTTRKTGKTGPLAFVMIRHDIRQRQSLAVTEWQELVYRPDGPRPTIAPPMARTDEEDSFEVTFDPTMLFRYSALTFNGHRIHYDETYAVDVEGYDGLVVHGPMLAHMLMQMAHYVLGELNTFTYRATAPLMHHEKATLCWKDGVAWVRGPDGRQCMIAEAT